MIMCSRSTATEAGSKIQTAINAASRWAAGRGFRFYAEKTKAIRFTQTRRQEEVPTLFLEGSILIYEEQIKYLGMIFDKKNYVLSSN